MNIKVYSEIGKLKKVLVHRPGKEVERLYPEAFERLLFDDIMHLEVAQKEHDYFTDKLREEGVEVFYIEKLVAETLDKNPNLREGFIKKFIEESGLKDSNAKKAAYNFFNKNKDNLELIRVMIAGIKKEELIVNSSDSLASLVFSKDDYPFYIDPIPNILFQRDPIASIFDSMNIHSMNRVTRRREGIFYELLLKHNSEWNNIDSLLKKDDQGSVEGGDILVINKKTIFVGISERTNAEAIELLAKRAFRKYDELKTVVAVEIPRSHATMHLDTILTQMDYDKFSIDADMYKEKYNIFELTSKDGEIVITEKIEKVTTTLERFIERKLQFIVVGGGELVRAKREQWNDGANCLCIEPGVICVYDRNRITNGLMEEAGIRLVKIHSSELSRGRGGPRCMSMPLERESIN